MFRRLERERTKHWPKTTGSPNTLLLSEDGRFQPLNLKLAFVLRHGSIRKAKSLIYKFWKPVPS